MYKVLIVLAIALGKQLKTKKYLEKKLFPTNPNTFCYQLPMPTATHWEMKREWLAELMKSWMIVPHSIETVNRHVRYEIQCALDRANLDAHVYPERFETTLGIAYHVEINWCELIKRNWHTNFWIILKHFMMPNLIEWNSMECYTTLHNISL